MALEEYGRGCCVNCGYLCRMDYNGVLSRERPDLRYREIPEHDRRQNRWHGQSVGPWCFRGVDLLSEINAVRDQDSGSNGRKILDEQATIVLAKEDRGCDKWFPYTPTFTPSEHLAHQEMLNLERSRQETQEALLDRQQAFQAEETRNTREWQADQQLKMEQRIEQRHKEQLLINVLFVVAIQSVVLVSAALIQANWIPKWFGLFDWFSKWFAQL